MPSTKTDYELWEESYGKVYDLVTTYIPYQEHIHRLVDLLALSKNSSLLDLGCGTGSLLEAAKDGFGCHITGIDVSKTMLHAASLKLGVQTRLIQSDLSLRLPFNDNSFDRLVSNNVLGFLSNPALFWDEISRVLTRDGIFVISTMLPGFNQLTVYLDHVKKAGYSNTIRSLIPSLKVGYYNYKITKSTGNRSYAGYTGHNQKSLEELITTRPFYEVRYSYSYASQNIVVRGLRL